MNATATLLPSVSANQTQQRQSEQHWTGLLADISPNGAQVILPPGSEKYLKKGQQVNVRIKTILEDIDFNVTAEVKYVIKSQGSGSLQTGVHFTDLESNSRAQYEIMRFTKYIDRFQTSTDSQVESTTSAEN
jgi:c-di-GMP-binding flagellar brake protein YcgR